MLRVRGRAARGRRMSELRGGDVVVRPRPCVHCKVTGDAQLARQITGAGATNVLWVCLTCNRATPAQSGGLYVPHVKLEALGIIPDDLPVWRDYSKDTRCVACGAGGGAGPPPARPPPAGGGGGRGAAARPLP